jgi:hypothetical protein
MAIAIFILLNSCLVRAQDWWTIPRQETRTHLSYVASHEGKEGLEELKEKAFMAAAAGIVREHFGITVEASESVIEDTGNSKYQFFTKIKSDPMIIKGLKLTDLKIFEAGELTRVLVRVEISKEDLAQAVKGHITEEVQNIYGRGKGENYLLVTTSPPGAMIHIAGIDKNYFVQGTGDAKFYLPKGDYHLSINEPGYEKIQTKFRIFNQDQELNFNLNPVVGRLTIETHPSSAVVRPISPLEGSNPYHLIPQKKYRFRVSHPDYYEEEFEYSIPGEGDYSKTVSLQSRSSKIRFLVTPEPNLISVNNRHYQNGDRIDVSEENLHLVIEANGFERIEKTMKIHPNRHYPDEYIKLSPKKATPPFKWPKLPSFNFFADGPLKKRFEYNPYVQLDGAGTFSILPLSFFLEKGSWSAGLSYNYIDSSNDNGERKLQKTISDFSVSVRFSLKHLGSVVPYLSLTTGSYQVKEITDDLITIEESERNYSFYGIGGGLRFYYTDSASIHAEMIQISKKLSDGKNLKSDTPKSESEIKATVGLGWEF